jgi:hypothetical protein
MSRSFSLCQRFLLVRASQSFDFSKVSLQSPTKTSYEHMFPDTRYGSDVYPLEGYFVNNCKVWM